MNLNETLLRVRTLAETPNAGTASLLVGVLGAANNDVVRAYVRGVAAFWPDELAGPLRRLCDGGDTLSRRAIRRAASSGGSLAGARLAGCRLRGLTLRSVDLCCADLRGADLRRANFHWANLRGACLDGALVDGARFSSACLDGVSLVGVDLDAARTRGAYIRPAPTWAALDA